MQGGLSYHQVAAAVASTTSSRQRLSTARQDDDFFPPLLSLANARASRPPMKPYTFVSCLFTDFTTKHINFMLVKDLTSTMQV